MNSVVVAAGQGSAVVKLSGELDLAMARTVRTRLVPVDGDVELDCDGLTFMGAAGVGLFIELHHVCINRGAKLTVVNAPRCVTRLLAVTGLDDLLDVHPQDAGA